MDEDVVIAREDEPLIGVIGRMRGRDASCAVVVDAAGKALGVLDAALVLRRVVFETSPERPVRSVLDGRPAILPADEPLHRAAARMLREQVAEAAVIDGSGRPVGVLRRDRAMEAAIDGLIRPLERASGADDVAGLAAAKAAQAEVVGALLDEHQPGTVVLEFVNDANLATVRRLCEMVAAAMAADGWGTAPVPAAVIVMGSAGRGESLLHPDQDNGLIIAEPEADDRGRADGYYSEFARRLTRDLATVGFPLCPGDVMATNPAWRMTLSRWCAQIDGWVRARSNIALLNADIFFDFRAAFGPPELARSLREQVIRSAKGNGPFLAQVAWKQADETAGGGLFGRLLGGLAGAAEDHIDLKLHGTMPLVEAVRLLSLWAGIEATGTLPRLAALRDSGLIEPEDHDELADCFGVLIELLLRRQVDDARAGRPVGTVIAGAALRRPDRDRLDGALRRIASFRRTVAVRLLGAAPGAAAGV